MSAINGLGRQINGTATTSTGDDEVVVSISGGPAEVSINNTGPNDLEFMGDNSGTWQTIAAGAPFNWGPYYTLRFKTLAGTALWQLVRRPCEVLA